MKARTRGFSLLELMVALSIMALSLGLLYRSMGSSARQAGEMEVQQRAVLLAQSLLASRDALTSSGWNDSGQDDGYTWSVHSTLYTGGAATTSANTTTPEALRLHEVRVTVERADDVRPLQLEVVTLLPERKLFQGEVAR